MSIKPFNNLAFVTISNPDDLRNPDTQRKIRRHTMRDIGYARRKARATVMELELLVPHLEFGAGTSNRHSQDQEVNSPPLYNAARGVAPARCLNPLGILAGNPSLRDLQLIDFSKFSLETVDIR